MANLRERKFARTRISLYEALVVRLQEHSFEHISVRDLCEDVQVSEGTFFNYFPEKSDLLLYSMQIWGVLVTLRLRDLRSASCLEKVLSVFELTILEMEKHPRLLFEVISLFARADFLRPVSLTQQERGQIFSDNPLAENSSPAHPGSIFTTIALEAKARREIPEHADPEGLALGLEALFYGLIVSAKSRGTDHLKKVYRKQVDMFWTGGNQWLGGFHRPGES